MFADQISLFEQVLLARTSSCTDDQRDLLLEAVTRLRQCQYSFDRARSAAESGHALWKREAPITGRNPLAVADQPSATAKHVRFWQRRFEIRFYAEAFYYFAWRLQTILAVKGVASLGIAFSPVAGIRVARNQLIEHPEKKLGGPLSGGVEVTTGPFDVRLKVPPSEPAMDVGLVANAKELSERLDAALKRALRTP
jgi:hypothetical protein